MKLQMAHDRDARDILIREKEKQDKISELEKLLLLTQLENFTLAQHSLKMQIVDAQKENETELEKLNNIKKDLEENLKEMENRKKIEEKEEVRGGGDGAEEKLKAEIEVLKQRIENEKNQREDGLNILRNDLAHALKMEKSKEIQAKEERRKEKEKLRKRNQKILLREHKQQIQRAIQLVMQQEADKIETLLENKAAEMKKSEPNENLQKELDVLQKQLKEKQQFLEKDKPEEKSQLLKQEGIIIKRLEEENKKNAKETKKLSQKYMNLEKNLSEAIEKKEKSQEIKQLQEKQKELEKEMEKKDNENKKQIELLSNCLDGIGQLLQQKEIEEKKDKKDEKQEIEVKKEQPLEKLDPPKPENYVPPTLFESGEEPPVPAYLPPPPVPWDDEDEKEDTVPQDDKYHEEIAKGFTLKKQRETEFQMMNEERKKTDNKFNEVAEKYHQELAKLQFKLRAAEERQENDLALIKDKQIDKSERKAAKQRVNDRMILVPQLNYDQNTLEIKLEKNKKESEKALDKIDHELDKYKKQMDKEQEWLDKILEKDKKRQEKFLKKQRRRTLLLEKAITKKKE